MTAAKEFHRFWPFYKNLEKSNVEVTVDAMLSLRASCEQLDTYTTAYVNGKINDEKIKILEVEAKARSNQDTAVSLNSSVYVMGYELNNMEIEEDNFIELRKKPFYDFDEHMTGNVPIGPVNIPINFGLVGTVSSAISANINAWSNQLDVKPAVEADAYIESVIDAKIAEARFGGELMLAKENIDLYSDAILDIDGDNSSVDINARVGHELEALRGRVYVSGTLRAKEEKTFEKELISHEGFEHKKTFYKMNKKVDL